MKPNHENLFRHKTTDSGHYSTFSSTHAPAPIAMAIPPPRPQPQPQKLLRPLHPSVVNKLDGAFVKLYNEHLAGVQPSQDINVVRANFSTTYRFATNVPTPVGGIGETAVPGWQKYPGDINVRVYVPPGEEPGTRQVWPVHFNFHGGGKRGAYPCNSCANSRQDGRLVISRHLPTYATTYARQCRAV